jgi:hypothetical protein
LSSIESEYGWESESFERARYDEWKRNGPTWQKEVISEAFIIWDCLLGNHVALVRDIHGITCDPPFFSKIRNEVWTHFENLPPEETKDVGRVRMIVMAEFERAVSFCLDLPEATREDLLKYLKEPSHTHESLFRRTVGLGSLPGGEDVYEKI